MGQQGVRNGCYAHGCPMEGAQQRACEPGYVRPGAASEAAGRAHDGGRQPERLVAVQRHQHGAAAVGGHEHDAVDERDRAKVAAGQQLQPARPPPPPAAQPPSITTITRTLFPRSGSPSVALWHPCRTHAAGSGRAAGRGAPRPPQPLCRCAQRAAQARPEAGGLGSARCASAAARAGRSGCEHLRQAAQGAQPRARRAPFPRQAPGRRLVARAALHRRGQHPRPRRARRLGLRTRRRPRRRRLLLVVFRLCAARHASHRLADALAASGGAHSVHPPGLRALRPAARVPATPLPALWRRARTRSAQRERNMMPGRGAARRTRAPRPSRPPPQRRARRPRGCAPRRPERASRAGAAGRTRRPRRPPRRSA